MGYEVHIELREVKFKKEHTENVIGVLKVLNQKWQAKSDWCRFDDSLEDIHEIIEDIGFSTSESDGFIKFEDFEREKLGDHENMFAKLAPFLEEGSVIVYCGEDDHDWKQTVVNGKVEVYHRENI